MSIALDTSWPVVACLARRVLVLGLHYHQDVVRSQTGQFVRFVEFLSTHYLLVSRLVAGVSKRQF